MNWAFPGLTTIDTADPDTQEAICELRTPTYQLAARIRYSIVPPEGQSSEFAIEPDWQSKGLGISLVRQMLITMRDQGCTTARLLTVTNDEPFLKYGCTIDGPDAIVDLINGKTIDLLAR
jgi:GNAT superfamily N-acetyltransferase